MGTGVFASLTSFARFVGLAVSHRYTYRLLAAFGLVIATVLVYKYYLSVCETAPSQLSAVWGL